MPVSGTSIIFVRSILMCRLFSLFFVGVFLMGSCVIVKHNEKNADGKKDGLEFYFANDAFDAKAFVEAMWDSELVPYAREHAVDLTMLIHELAGDEAKASAEYGKRQVAEGAPFNFVAKSEAFVLSVDTVSRVGTVELDLNGDTVMDAVLQIGPVFKGTSIRDALPFIKFDQFVNQLDFALLSSELNIRVRDSVLAGFDFSSGVGERLSFIGFFTYEKGKPVVITPVLIEWK